MKHLSLKAKLSLTLAVVFTVLALGETFFAFRYFEAAYTKSVSHDLMLMSATLADSIDSRLGIAQGALEAAAAALPAEAVANPSLARKFLGDRVSLQSIFPDGILLVSASRLVAAYPPRAEAAGEVLARSDFFSSAVARKSPHLSPYPEWNGKSAGIVVTIPLIDAGGTVRAVMAGVIDLAAGMLSMERKLRERIGEGHIVIFSPDGRYLLHHGENARGKKIPADGLPLFRQALAGEEATGETFDCCGMRVLASFRKLEGGDGVVAINYPLSLAYAPLEKAKGFFLAAILFGTAVLFAIAWLLTQRITEPLRRMTRHVESLPQLPPEKHLLQLDRGDEIGVLAAAFDRMLVTLESRQAALRDSEIRFRAIFEAASDAVFLADAASGKIVDANAQAEKLLGCPKGEIIGRHQSQLHPAEDLAYSRETFERHVRTDGAEPVVAQVLTADGTKVPVEINASAIELAPGEKYLLGIFRDIGERKKAEERILALNRDLQRRAAELAAMNRDLESFSYSLSHDLKAPLTCISIAAEALRETLAEAIDDNIRFLLSSIACESQRMEDLIDAMLLLSRVSRTEIRYERIDLSALVRKVSLRLQTEHPQRAVEWKIAPEAIVQGDARLLMSVMENLAENAWKYTGKQEAAHIEFGVGEEEGKRIFFVRDDGAGFDMAKAGPLFQPFQRLHTEREFKGSGIGLATVYRIIERHGGRIWAQAAPGKGATFYFTLPA